MWLEGVGLRVKLYLCLCFACGVQESHGISDRILQYTWILLYTHVIVLQRMGISLKVTLVWARVHVLLVWDCNFNASSIVLDIS